MALFFVFFVLSGFCSLVYEVVWLRLAMASYGVTTPMVSIVLSLFMAGLGLGTWAAGRFVSRATHKSPAFPLQLYALAESLIGLSGLAVPCELDKGRALLQGLGASLELGSSGYYLLSGLWLTLALLPWCCLMGATFPFAMEAIRGAFSARSSRSFSYLYLANVLGAVLGTLISAFFLIELVGFRGTLRVAVAVNALLAAAAFLYSKSMGSAPRTAEAARSEHEPRPASAKADRSPLVFLFATGLVSMGMEVVWVRQFTPYLGTVVYAFAAILSIYLLATFAGTQLYRWRTGGQGPRVTGLAWTVACVSAFLPLLTADYRWGTGPGMLSAAVRVALGIVPFCACLGFLTPMLVDRWSGGQPRQAGFAYAVNIIGSLLGPLLAGFLLLPLLGERWSLVALALPLFLIAGWNRILRAPQAASARTSWAPAAAAGLASLSLVLFTRDYAWLFPDRVTLRDSTATVVATGDGMEKQLLVNGYGMTSLTPITKMMAHLPAVHLSESPRKSLALCFGMGTSFRSLVSWGGQVTAVELCPSVPKLFGFYHADAADVVKQPGAQIIVDDARRFLERTPERYDLITIDPPPPLEAAASSLLYSTEFYKLVIDRMSPEGIFQQWNPGGEPAIQLAVARTVALSFPHVRAFKSMEGWGVHYLASLKPIPALSAEDAAGRLPAKAASDLVEWGPTSSAATQFALVLERELDLAPVLQRADLPTIEDDRPFNEYYVLRRWRGFRSGNR